jgi:DNA polymerase I
MQLVTDQVTMFDTMKDRRIGIAEVIEKFGVPPEKVVEVQALAGDSTDNVPGVPGIGIKTAAQLIVEYGDLETLLQRAGEIKQPKRREALIENAEKARISRQLVLLDDKVKLDVPLDELAVHEPDARKLIAFLKAMEFSTLTRRVSEYSQIDPADVAADGKNSSGNARVGTNGDAPLPLPLAGEVDPRFSAGRVGALSTRAVRLAAAPPPQPSPASGRGSRRGVTQPPLRVDWRHHAK